MDTCLAPTRAICKRALEDEAVYRRHHVEVFGNREELVGGQYALGRMLPTHEGLDTGDIQVRGLKLKLVEGNELPPLQSGENLVGRALGVDDVVLDVDGEEL